MPRISLAPWQARAIYHPAMHLGMFGGVGVGKSFTGSQFAIDVFRHRPHLTGFVGANTYDQMNQATLRELFYWLPRMGFDHVIHKKPPPNWMTPQVMPDYHNVLSVRNQFTGAVSYAFTRVLGKGDSLRGIEFAWYWIDETRDTPENTHDIILSRMREDEWMKGLVTTTTNGEDWCYRRFVLGNQGDGLYASMHVPTSESVRYGINTEAYYRTLLRTYSPLLAEQELHAKHVNVSGGRAYYAFDDRNKADVAPWGDKYPSRDRPIVVGCDFNFSPAPHTWIVGQVGPPVYNALGLYLGDCIHWFRELSGVGISTPQMAQQLLAQYPGYFYEVYGDMSGRQGTTSNAGQTDYDQIGIVLSDAGAMYSIAVEQMDEDENKQNPRVRSRVENMNAMARNAAGERRMTYSKNGCPLFDGDMRIVGWKQNVTSGRGTLDDGADKQRTHSSDAAGYAVWKKFPPGRKAMLIESIPSSVRSDL